MRGRGELFGDYIVIDVIAEGSESVVYMAYEPVRHRRLAIKTYVPDGDPECCIQRARLLAALEHPNVARVDACGSSGGEVFLAMDLIDGPTVARWLSRSHRAWKDIVDVFVSLGRGLSAAHASGLAHGAFGPRHAMIDERGCPRVVGFGIRNETSDPVADQLSFSAALCEALGGQRALETCVPKPVSAVVTCGLSTSAATRWPLAVLVRRLEMEAAEAA